MLVPKLPSGSLLQSFLLLPAWLRRRRRPVFVFIYPRPRPSSLPLTTHTHPLLHQPQPQTATFHAAHFATLVIFITSIPLLSRDHTRDRSLPQTHTFATQHVLRRRIRWWWRRIRRRWPWRRWRIRWRVWLLCGSRIQLAELLFQWVCPTVYVL